MKANKALKRLAKIETLMSDVAERFSASAPHLREALKDLKAAVLSVKEAVKAQTSSPAAPKAPLKKAARARKKAVVKPAVASKAKAQKKRAVAKKAAKKKTPPKPMASAAAHAATTTASPESIPASAHAE
jgi:hypothetical protein